MTTAYLTVAIPYVNAEPHLGYAYELVLADVAARARRQRGDDVRFLGGTDDYSLKNVLAAEATGVPTGEFVDAHAQRFADLAGSLDVSFDDFIRTSRDPRHRPAVERLWRACAARGDLYRRSFEGDYCVGCEQFWRPDELIADGDGRRCCPEHLAPVERVAEDNWFFRLSAYQDHLERLLASGELQIHPAPFRDEVLSFVRGGLVDISVSRSARRARGWGIAVPDDPQQVIYVWFDALANYVSALGFGDAAEGSAATQAGDSVAYRRWWLDADERVHVIGKGILRFHAVYWPAFLASAGQPAPTRVEVHPYLTAGGAKLSKSAGEAAPAPSELAASPGTDALRWWFASSVSPVADTDFTEQRLVEVANADLANGVGNVVNRIVALARRDRGAGVARSGVWPVAATVGLEADVLAALADFDLRGACRLLRDAVGALNRDIEATRPWTLDGGDLDAVLARQLATAQLIARALTPIAPGLAARLEQALTAEPAGPVYARL